MAVAMESVEARALVAVLVATVVGAVVGKGGAMAVVEGVVYQDTGSATVVIASLGAVRIGVSMLVAIRDPAVQEAMR